MGFIRIRIMVKKLIILILVFGAIMAYFFIVHNKKKENVPDWQRFDAGIFKKAKKERKLVLLHLGANWCHWCHVMEAQTYTDPFVLELLNKSFIVCKEDHDERQDLTSLYAEYGWPATIVFDADGNELLKEAGFIAPDRFIALLKKLVKSPTPLPSSTVAFDVTDTGDSSVLESVKKLQDKFINSLDVTGGGFKYPQKYIDFETFEYAFNHSDKDSTLTRWLYNSVLNSGSINDYVWGGVFQYSTHNDWNHVHYEKLLSIQARYIKMYCWYYKRFNDVDALKQAEAAAGYVNRFLSDSSGGFYNAQDADLKPGEKAIEYFKLNDADRIHEGIPAIDKNTYTSDNAELIESYVILSATTGNTAYLQKAIKCFGYIKKKNKINNAYAHGSNYTSNISLKDNLAIVKAALVLYRATQDAAYRSEAARIIQEISNTFYSGNGYMLSFIGNSPLKVGYNIAENIEACRLLNYCSHVFNEPKYKTQAQTIFRFLTNRNLVESMSTEPGILSAYEELRSEPIKAALMIKSGEDLKTDYLNSALSFPKFYFENTVYTAATIPSDKYELFDAYDKNFIIVCTSSYCSPPVSSKDAFEKLLFKREFSNKFK